MMRILFLCLALIIAMPACQNRKKEKELEKRSFELKEKEQQLLLREKTLDFREEELSEKLRVADSLSRADTSRNNTGSSTDSALINPAIVGNWQVKMTCTQTSCPGSAIGDTRTELWDLSYEGTHIVAKANDRGRLVRVYSGLLKGNAMELIQHRDSAALTYDTRMVVRLNIVNENTIEGQREIIREDECRILYALQMNKQ